MVQSDASSVDAYLAGAPPEHADRARRVRELARATLSDHDERMYWGMPAYLCEGRVSFGFAVQKQYLSLYFRVPGALDRNAVALAGVKRGKACLRFRKSAPVDWELIERLLVDTRKGTPAPA